MGTRYSFRQNRRGPCWHTVSAVTVSVACYCSPVVVLWIKLHFLQMWTNENAHCLVLYQHAPVSVGWNWILFATQMRTRDALVLKWLKIQEIHLLKQTNKQNPSDTVSKLKDSVKHWPGFFWGGSIPCAGPGPALQTVALSMMPL